MAMAGLDGGRFRVAEKTAQGWQVNEWLKKAVLLSFRLNPMQAISGGPGGAPWWDKVPSKFAGWGETEFTNAERIRRDRLQAHAIEAAEQCGGTYVPPVEDLRRTLDEETYVPGKTRIFTRWSNFPEVSEADPDDALHAALKLLLDRVN